MAEAKRRRWFGTDGVRGPVGKAPMTEGFVESLGRAAGKYFQKASLQKKLLVARDTRESGPKLEAALIAGLNSVGVGTEAVGVMPSGAAAMVVEKLRAGGAAVLSASHNPASDNGVKFFGANGGKLEDEEEAAIESYLEDGAVSSLVSRASPTDFHYQTKAFDFYRQKLRQGFPDDFSLKGIRVVVDAAHGAAWRTTPEILREWGAEVEVIAGQPNGKNINDNCGSEHPEKLMAAVQKKAGWIGLAHDGDADRLVLVDEEGTKLDGDEMLALLALDALERGQLAKKTLVVTVMSNLGLNEAVEAKGGKVVRTAVGDRQVAAEMRRSGAILGGEQSGHLLFLDVAPAGDGLLSACKTFAVLQRTGKQLSQLRRGMKKYPQKLINVRVRHKPAWETLAPVAEVVREMEGFLGKKGRILLRYSGTENLIRLLVEADENDKIRKVEERLEPILQEHLGEKR